MATIIANAELFGNERSGTTAHVNLIQLLDASHIKLHYQTPNIPTSSLKDIPADELIISQFIFSFDMLAIRMKSKALIRNFMFRICVLLALEDVLHLRLGIISRLCNKELH